MKRIVLLLALAGALTAQNWNVKLIKPPPQNVFFENLWKCRITNNEAEPVKVTLTGWVTESGKEVARGTSNPITIPPGGKMITSADITGGTWDYEPKYEPFAMQRRPLPPGSYVFCIKVNRAEDKKELAQDCEDFSIGGKVSPPRLVAPPDGSTILQAFPTFVWTSCTPPPAGVTYTICIAEMQEGMSAEQALEDPRPLFEKADIRTTTLTYPPSADALVPGMKCAWQVTAMVDDEEIGSSDMWSFTPKSSKGGSKGTYGIDVTEARVECSPGSSLCYDYEVDFDLLSGTLGPSASGGEAWVQKVEVVGMSTPPTLSLIPDPPTPMVVPYTTTTTVTLTGRICFSTPPPPNTQVKFGVSMEDPQDPAYYKAYAPETAVLPSCACCKDFTSRIDSLEVTESGSGNYTLTGLLSADPNPICKIQARIVNFAYIPVSIPPASGCPNCVWPSKKFGNFGQPVSLGTLTPPPALTTIPPYKYSREFVWEGTPFVVSGTPFSVPLLLPDASTLVGCCMDTIKMCIRFSFTDTNCVTCDTVIKFWFTRSPVSEVTLAFNDDENTDVQYSLSPQPPTLQPAALHKGSTGFSNPITMMLTMALFGQIRREIIEGPSVAPVGEFRSKGTPFCTDFNDPTQSIPNCWSGTNAGITKSNSGSIGGSGTTDYYLRGSDSSGASTLTTTCSEYLGDWTPFINNGCGSLCFDMRIFDDGIDSMEYSIIDSIPGWYPGCEVYKEHCPQTHTCINAHLEVPPWIRIYGANGLIAVFKTNFTITEDGGSNPGWHHICAPINCCQGGVLPSNGMGQWVMINGSCNDWDLLLTGVTKIQFPEEFSCIPQEVVGYDNFCIWDTGDCGGTGCEHCCDTFEIAVNSSVKNAGSTWWGWYVKADLTTGPNAITEIKADLVNFYVNDKPGCKRCVNQNISLGSIIPCHEPETQIDWNHGSSPANLISPTTTCSNPWNVNSSPRELVWNNIDDNGLYKPRPPLSGEGVTIRLVFPPPHTFQNTCCFDTIRFCIRWSFTDVECRTCDTLVCYKFAQQYKPGGGEWIPDPPPPPPPPPHFKSESDQSALPSGESSVATTTNSQPLEVVSRRRPCGCGK